MLPNYMHDGARLKIIHSGAPYGLGEYVLTIHGDNWALTHQKYASSYILSARDLIDLDRGNAIVPVDPAVARKQAQLIAIRAASPMRPIDGRTADVDGLALFDAVRSPSLF